MTAISIDGYPNAKELDAFVCLSSEVVHGFKRGSKELGWPTANMDDKCVEAVQDKIGTGIYFGWATVDGNGPYAAAISCGWNPFFQNQKVTVEPYLLHEFEEDFYGSTLKLIIVGYLRPEINVNSLDELKELIGRDVKVTEDLTLKEGAKYADVVSHDFFK